MAVPTLPAPHPWRRHDRPRHLDLAHHPADLLGDPQVVDPGVRPLRGECRVAGPARLVRCPPGDDLVLHAAIRRAEPGPVIVVQADGGAGSVYGALSTRRTSVTW